MTTSAIALGPMPGVNMALAGDVVRGEFGEHLHLPQLPERGVFGDLLARTAGLLDGMYVDRGPRRWQLRARPQRATHLLRDGLERDLDDLQSVWGDAVDEITVAVTGPWSLSSQLELPGGHRALSEPAAVRDIAGALIVGAAKLCADLRRRFGAHCRIHIDEPYVAACLKGDVAGASEFHEIPAVDWNYAAQVLAEVIDGVDVKDHSCVSYLNCVETGAHTAISIVDSVAEALGVDRAQAPGVIVGRTGLRATRDLDAVAHQLDSGGRLALAWVDHDHAARDIAIEIARFLDMVGVDRVQVAAQLDIAPSPGIPGASLVECGKIYTVCASVSSMLRDDVGDL